MIGRQRTSRTSNLGICSAPTVWSRNKLLGMLTGVAAMVVLLVVGVVLAVVHALRPGGNPAGSLAGEPHGAVGTGTVQSVSGAGGDPQPGLSDSPADTTAQRDQLARRPLPVVPESASHPSAVSLADPGAPWLLPAATSTGPAGVSTGFAQTPQGAMAQLAAIDTAALSSASLAGARAVITGWAAPGGPTTSSWSVIRAIAALLSETDLSGGTHQLAVLPTPLMGLIKGSLRANTAGPTGSSGSGGSGQPVFVVPCVDFELDVTVTSTARGAAADCQRMVWTTNSRDTADTGGTGGAGGAGGRWLIGPGPEPAAGPSVWPDTDLAITVGYRDLRRG